MADDFVGKDPRGRVVVFYDNTWQVHCAPHHEEVGGQFLAVTSVLEQPLYIYANPNRPGVPARRGHERYIGKIDAVDDYIVIPMVTITTEEITLQGQKVPAGSRVATTVFTTSALPGSGLIWKKT